MKLMIVESPTKVKKISQALGPEWEIAASSGHIRDLPKYKDMGIDFKNKFSIKYEYIPRNSVNGRTYSGGQDRIDRIKPLVKKADMVYLATDPDREGEAIAWHLKECLGLKDSQYQRVTFKEITNKAIKEAIEAPRKIDAALVRAQEARRALDRLVGWMVSPALSNMSGQNLSAGRVQSVGVRLIVDREREIAAFKKVSHFGAIATFDGGWSAKWDTKPYLQDSKYILDRALAEKAAGCKVFAVDSSQSGSVFEAPPSAFSTSLMLQAASVKLKFSPATTTKLAQRLFEQGVVTYIRTDSVNVSDEAADDIRAYARTRKLPIPDKKRVYKSNADAQEAHEAIRPTHIDVTEAGDSDEERALYALIWKRTIASQLASAEYLENSLILKSENGGQKFTFKAKGRTIIDAGWRKLTATDDVEDQDIADKEDDSGRVPDLAGGTKLTAIKNVISLHETEPPKRYTQAEMIKKLEREGIGRPATFAAILNNIMSRSYIVEKKRLLYPQSVGEMIVDTLTKAGFSFMNYDYTRKMEERLDKVAGGNDDYEHVVGDAFNQLHKELAGVPSSGGGLSHPCPKCGQPLRRFARKSGKGYLWACSDKECKTFLDDENGKPFIPGDFSCPKCKQPLRRFARKSGKGYLWACSDRGCETFFDDKNGKPLIPEVNGKPFVPGDHACPKCGQPLRRFARKTGKGYLWACSNKKCETFLEDENGKPVFLDDFPCPKCGTLLKRFSKKDGSGHFWSCPKDICNGYYLDDNKKPVL